MRNDLKDTKKMLKEYYNTKKKVFYLNERILNYKHLREDDKSCEEVLSAEKEMLEEYKKKIKEYVFIESILETEFPEKRKILDSRYLHGKTWQYVALNNYVSLRHCFNVVNEVLEKIQQSYQELYGESI